MNFKTSDKVNLFYEMEGDGHPLVFLNGMWGDSSTWKKLLPVFAKEYTCICLDHRGVGNSDKWIGEYSYDLHARDVKELLDYLSIEKAHFIGTCHGGMVATTFAKNYPLRISSMAVNGTQMLKSGRQSMIYQGWMDTLLTAGFEVLYKANIIPSIMSEKFINENKDRLDEILAATLERIEKEAAVCVIKAAINYGYSEEAVKAFKIPALLMASEEDRFCPPYMVEETHRLWQNSEYYLFKNVGHFPQRENAEEYVGILMKFIEKHSAKKALV